MTFSEKLDEQFSDFLLKRPDYSEHLLHQFADYVELLALFSNETITEAIALPRIIGEPREEELEEDTEIGSKKTECDDKDEAWIIQIYSVLSTRADDYEDNDYPFNYEPGKITLKSSLSVKQKMYLALLMSSNLSQFNKHIEPTLTSEFEIISYNVLKNYLPNRAEVKQFGKNSNYSGTAIKKIKKLASDMHLTTDDNEISNISTNNTQDRGLDVIGWIPFKDNTSNMIVILGQCACGKDWYKKKAETDRYTKYFNFKTLKPIYALFIPYALLSSQQSFYQSDEITNFLIFERARILDYTIDTSYFDNLNSKQLVEKSIEYEEDIV